MPGRFGSLFARRPPTEPPPPPPDAVDGEPVAFEEPVYAEPAAPPPPPVRPYPPERERRDLARRREIEIRDVGGLALEMARRDDWRYPLLQSRCAEVLALEERIHTLDALIAAGQMAARGVAVAPCRCGAPLVRGVHFCSNCGRAAPETPPVVTCSHCGQPLPAEANFCPVCGNAVAAEEFAAGADLDDTFVAPAEPAEEPSGDR